MTIKHHPDDSMLVAFTITPWLAYHLLNRKYAHGGAEVAGHHAADDIEAVKQSRLYKVFYPLMAPLLHSRLVAWSFMTLMLLLTIAAMGGGGLLARVGREAAPGLIGPGVEQMEMQGRAMTGWLRVFPEAVESDDELAAWVRRCVEFVRTLD